MRRTHLRGHENILKRLLIHGGAFNLSLLLRKELGAGTPRGLAEAGKGLQFAVGGRQAAVIGAANALASAVAAPGQRTIPTRFATLLLPARPRRLKTATFTAGC